MTREEIYKAEQEIFKYGLFQFRKYDEFLMSNLINNKITFGSPHNFNDPFDCNLPIILDISLSDCIDFIRYFPDSIYQSDDWIVAKAKDILNSPEDLKAFLTKILFENRRFSCFNLAKKKQHLRNSLFWANYANKHQGICMKFSGDLLKYYYENHRGIISLVPVEYKNQDIPEFNFIKNRANGNIEGSVQYFFGTKSSEWTDEDEMRFIYSSKEKVIEPFVNFEFDPKTLVEVFIGCRVKENEIKTLIYCLSDKKYDHVDIFHLAMDNKKFRLNENLIRPGFKI